MSIFLSIPPTADQIHWTKLTLYAVSFCTWLVYIRADRLHRSADPLGVNLIRTPNSRFVNFGFNTLDSTTRALSHAFVLLSSFVYEA